MGLSYQEIVDVYKAQELVRKYPGYWIEQKNKRTYRLEPVTYSPQEICIDARPTIRNEWYNLHHLPAGIHRHAFPKPHKEYISFEDDQKITRFYLVPPEGLRLRKKGNKYTVLNPIQDYSISVDRSAAKRAREDAADLIHYIETIWKVVSPPPYNERPYGQADFNHLPSQDKKDSWFELLLRAKYPRNGYGLSLSSVIQKIRNSCTRSALAYKVVPVPNTRMDHTEHWGVLEELKKAGKM